MSTRSTAPIARFVGSALLVAAISLFALGGVASAHVVTSINADCYQVTVHFGDFPDAGVGVHIAAAVNGQTTGSDVLITSATSEAHLDISPLTAPLGGTPANIDVDVTWTYLGPQHVHQSLTLTCGSSTTTTQAGTTTTAPAPTTTAPAPTTTAATTTTPSAPATTTTQVRGTTVVATTTPASTTTETIRRQGTTVVGATTTTMPAVAVLPRTGSGSAFPLMFGLSSLIAGALLLVRQRGAEAR